MSKQFKLFGLLFTGMALALSLAMLLSTGRANAAPQSAPAGGLVAQACDPSGSVDGTAEPSTVLPGQVVTFTVRNFRPGEEASFWFTIPSGGVFGTANPLCCVDNSGFIRFEPATLPNEFYLDQGRWALTVQGKDSNHTSVVYFCVVTQAQPTQPPPTATSAPATSTSVPATSTSAPASPTVAATTTTVVGTATVAGTVTAVGTSTVGGTTPTTVATSVATTVATTIATTVATSTTEATAAPLPTEEIGLPTPEVVPTIVGMPSTGAPDTTLLLVLVMFGMSLLAIGLVARRSIASGKR